MTLNEFFVSSLRQSLEMFKMTLADMSEAELMIRPVPGANHANWMLGHLVCSEIHLVTAAGGRMPEIPAGLAERYTKETVGIDDASRFAKKAELLALYEKARAATIEWVKTLTPAQFEAKGPMPFTPTVADLCGMASVHLAMHLGQIQVLRRKLGKPILF